MNFLLVLCVFIGALAIVMGQGAPETTDSNIITECAQLHKVTPLELMQMRTTKDKGAVKADDHMKCFAKCVVDGAHMIRPDGSVNVARVSELTGRDEKIAMPAIKMCRDRIADYHTCDDAWDLYKCFFQNL